MGKNNILNLTLLHLDWPKLYGVLAILSAIGLNLINLTFLPISLQVKLGVFMAYLKSIGVVLSFFTVLFYILYNASSVYSNIWLSEWSNDASMNFTAEERNSKRNLRLGVYGILGFVQGKSTAML